MADIDFKGADFATVDRLDESVSYGSRLRVVGLDSGWIDLGEEVAWRLPAL